VPYPESLVHLKYRPHIDGLRAMAIIPVVLFHSKLGAFSGGFLGVDIFFVISGFLITRIIAGEIDAGSFSILNFYERRVRRIIPALLLVSATVLVASSLLLFPKDYASAVRSIVAALLFSSNILFYLETDYFGAAADDQPMLHSWSLGVEEQFYIAFPILLILIHRYCRGCRTAILAGLLIGSLALSTVLAARDPDFVFYMIPARAWELLVGSLLALAPPARLAPGATREAIGACGLALLVLSVNFYSHEMSFQGLAGLPPVIGALLLIRYGEGTIVGRFLSLRPIVFIGLISYSLYLWHWPVIVFVEYFRDQALHGLSAALAIMLSLGLAALSWRFVERPFRSRSRMPRRRLLRELGTASAVVLATAGAAAASGGWPSRFPPKVLHYAAFSAASSPRRDECHDPLSGAKMIPPCRLGAPVAPRIAVWGDSHGVELAYAFGLLAQQRNQSLWQLTASACPPLAGVAFPGRERCRAHNDAVLEMLRRTRSIETVVLAAYWASGQNRKTPGLAAGLGRTVDQLRAAGKHVVVIGPVPPSRFDVPRRLAHLAQRGKLARARGIAVSELDRRTRYLSQAFAAIQARHVPVYFPAAALCSQGRCRIVDGTTPLYFDRHHLSVPGARLVAARAAPLIFASAPIR
jgi:peptidoglycan/LPS O-acetylase OafA/YrhL